jgi:hypothetical protein
VDKNGRRQRSEDCGMRATWANSWWDPSQKRAGGVAQGVGPEFKPQYHNKYINKQTKSNVEKRWPGELIAEDMAY